MLHYIHKSFFGKPLYAGTKPFQKVVNNGCTIETQSVDLIQQLQRNEMTRNSEVIDWWLFKPGATILFDNHGNQFGCTSNVDGQWITLVQIVG